PRCPFAVAQCSMPQMLAMVSEEQAVRCHRAVGLQGRDWPAAEPIDTARQQANSSGSAAIISGVDLQKRFVLPHQGGLISWKGGLPRLNRSSVLTAVSDVTLQVRKGEVLGVVGESGSGKSTLGRLLLRLSAADSGTLTFDGKPVDATPAPSFRRRAQIVFQSTNTSLNPRRTVGQILKRSLVRYGAFDGWAAEKEIDRLLDTVRLSPSYRHRYPHQLSGGEKQRVGIARALSTKPDFVVCDEAVSALDVSVQAAILNLLADLRDDTGVSYLFITHDIGVVAHIADRIAVMYRGKIVEEGPVDTIIHNPSHPYTKTLISAVPKISTHRDRRAGIVTVPTVAERERARGLVGGAE
ncbi:MAG: oligopeptide/dipeptide ABC transporter ATP-binding protein, partial [Phyllobacterium sp.]